MRIKWFIILVQVFFATPVIAQYPEAETNLDRKVKAFLEDNVDNWRDMNVPVSDGRILYDLVLNNGYTKAVEIGTSTGHSAIWIAWALSKTGGRLITIEINKERWLKAKANFKKAGVDKYVDARLGDAHILVPQLPGKYDFVFCDADKYWFKNYFMALDPKLDVGGCFAAHNASLKILGIREFLEHVESLGNYQTTMNNRSRMGISVSCKTAGHAVRNE